VRLLGCTATLLGLLVVGGCAGSTPDTSPPTKEPDGTASVDAFADYSEAVDEDWERSPVMAAGEFLHLHERTASRTTVEGVASAEGQGPQTVTVTLDGLLDDSVRTERWKLTFEPDDDVYRLTHAEWAQRCQPGRGHRGFSPDPCA
jgi:hypothetical protein